MNGSYASVTISAKKLGVPTLGWLSIPNLPVDMGGPKEEPYKNGSKFLPVIALSYIVIEEVLICKLLDNLVAVRRGNNSSIRC